MKRLVFVATIGFLGLFLFSVAVQLNDPDPIRWMVVYGAAAAGCTAWLLRRPARRWHAGIAAVATVWAVVTLAGVRLSVPVAGALRDWHTHAGGSEQLREGLGLCIVAVWMSVLAVVGTRR